MVFVQYHNIGYHIGYLTEIRLYLSVKADHSKFYYYIVHYRGLLVKKNSLNVCKYALRTL